MRKNQVLNSNGNIVIQEKIISKFLYNETMEVH
jgi:hypothetical protein